MISHIVNSIREARTKKLKDEITARDYRLLKVLRQEFGHLVEEEYPGESEWYNNQVAEIHKLEGRV